MCPLAMTRSVWLFDFVFIFIYIFCMLYSCLSRGLVCGACIWGHVGGGLGSFSFGGILLYVKDDWG